MNDYEAFEAEWAQHVREAWAQQPRHPTATEQLRDMHHTCQFCADGNDWHPDTLGGQMYELRLGFHAIGVTIHRSKAWQFIRHLAVREGE